MKAVILAGGYGTRLSEETGVKPKPMVEIGDKPILWHIMKMYSAHGINDFVICLGYRGHVIKEYFTHYVLRTSYFAPSTSHGCCHNKYGVPSTEYEVLGTAGFARLQLPLKKL